MNETRRSCDRCGEPFHPETEFGAWLPSCACIEEARAKATNFALDRIERAFRGTKSPEGTR